jgi:hypothetical protein
MIIRVIIAMIIGIIGAFLSSKINFLLLSRRDKWVYSKFRVALWKISWWIGGFILFAGLTLYFWK